MGSGDSEKATQCGGEQKTVQGLLVSALDMEDEIAHGVYSDYMDRKNWPEGMKDRTFEQVRSYLATLLEDTRRHRCIVKSLQEKLGRDDG